MEFENSFVVAAPIEELWDLLLDVERIAPCMPGAQVLGREGEDAYKVAVKVKLGPMSMLYKGDVEIVERDAEAHRATMRANARESRGQGTAKAEIVMALTEQDGGTRASIKTDMKMSGKAAAMGQGVISDVAGTLTNTFATNLADLVEGRGSASAAAASAPAADGAAAQPTPDASAASPPTPPRPGADASLPVGKIIASVISGRLRDPRTLAATAAVLSTVFLRLGMAIGRRRAA
jgi:carbon monoxide dehydrogenase subunit G